MSVEKQILFLLSRKEEMSGRELINIFEEMNYTPQSIRNLLSKLKGLSYISSVKRGVYKITSLGKEAYSLYTEKDNLYHKDWNGKWYFILLEIPEAHRKKRDLFRKGLLELGFGMLYKSIYVYPWNITDKVIHLTDTLEIEDCATIISSHEFLLNGIAHEGMSGANTARSIWDLEEINKAYKDVQMWLEDDYKPKIKHLVEDEEQNLLQLFTRYLELKKVRDDLIVLDPMLPAEFLPGYWLGTIVLFSIDQLLRDLASLFPKDSYYAVFVD